MRVLIVNTSERTGGAALAANRLMEALNNNGVKAKMLVRDKETGNISVVALKGKWQQQFHFLWERWCIFWHLKLSRKHLFDIDIANSGTDITTLPEFKEADIIHLHWINQGFLSLKDIKKILDSGKRVVWTMHDIWPATAICHITMGCEQFKTKCESCMYLPEGKSTNNIATKVWERKMQLMQHFNRIRFAACSKWLAHEAESSMLLQGRKVTTIPNPIDTNLFQPADQNEARQRLQLPTDKRLICFIAQRVTNTNKGMDYLVEACNKLVEQKSEDRLNSEGLSVGGQDKELKVQFGVVILGGQGEEFQNRFHCPTYVLGYVNEQAKLRDVYNAVDLFVLPSLCENLPNTIMEALACGVPCVGFNTGGIPEMIDHKENGYVAEYKNADDLAEGIRWVLVDADTEKLQKNAVRKVHTYYSQQSVAMKYIELYSSH